MRYLAACLLFLVTAVTAMAQFDTATVLGTVTDPSGAVVAQGQVKLHNAATGADKSAVSGEQGQFQFVDVPVGSYLLEVVAPGFQKAVASFQLNVGAHQRVDVKLQMASNVTTVTATAEAAQLDTDSSEHSQVVAEREIVELPLNGRNYSQLVALSTGVVPSPLSQSSSYLARDGSFNINGLRSVYSNYMLDGVDNNFYGTSNQGFSNQVVQLPPDSVAEFRVVTNNESAEYGRSGGATINVVTRYGTNDWHGRAWEFLRNTSMNAEGFFKPDAGGKPDLHRNQFGGNLGGPVLKDKLFFFLDYEGYRQTSSFTDRASLPSLAERGLTSSGASQGYYLIDNSDTGGTLPVDDPCPYAYGSKVCTSTTLLYAGLGLGGTTAQNQVGGTQYLTGHVPTSAVTPFAAALLSYLPAPTNTNTYNNYVVLHPESVQKDKGDIKIDYRHSSSLSMFARYSQARMNAYDPGTIQGVAGGDGDGHVFAPLKQVVGGVTWTISPVSVLDVRLGFSTMQAGKNPVLAGQNTMTGNLALSGLPTDSEWLGGVTYQYFVDGGFTSLGRQLTNPQHQNPIFWDPKANYTRLVRNHSLKAGVEYNLLHVAQEDLHPVLGANVYDSQISGLGYVDGLYKAYGSAYYGTATTETTRMFDYADFLFGYQTEMALSAPTTSNLRVWGLSGYLQDDWKLSRKLSLNLGLRYEYATPIYEANNRQANFDPSTASMIVASSSNRYTVNPNTKDFAPRVGASYSVDDKTVVRGGFGVSYSHWNRVGSNYLAMNPPYGLVAQTYSAPSLSTYSNVQSGFPASLVSSTSYSTKNEIVQYMPKDSPDTQVWNWFFGVQRDLGHNWVVDLSYVGNHGLNEIFINDINQATSPGMNSTTGNLTNVPYSAYTTIAGMLPWGTSDYNGLQIKLEKQFSHGLYLLESFTWSKDIDLAAQALDGGSNCSLCANGIPSVQNIYNWQADRGISSYNHPFIDSTTAVWTLPVGKGQWLLPNMNKTANYVLGGWQATGILQARSGDPLTFAYSPSTSQSVSPLISVDGRNAYRPNQSGAAVASGKSYQQYFNTASFSSPSSSNPFGNSPRNAVRGYDYWNFDLGLTKDFTTPAKTHTQFRAESFNLANHTNFGEPNPVYGSGTFGEITTTLPARILQLAVKVVF
ncbi:TonB-dependent receptor domain-containing protein [Telmatobacter bradus]|uniref:TonB-dependent receptor domain-containing protein n=1 Tax=Telmatobacter bradus TaxID=474953 RepID=UPI003B42CFF9